MHENNIKNKGKPQNYIKNSILSLIFIFSVLNIKLSFAFDDSPVPVETPGGTTTTTTPSRTTTEIFADMPVDTTTGVIAEDAGVTEEQKEEKAKENVEKSQAKSESDDKKFIKALKEAGFGGDFNDLDKTLKEKSPKTKQDNITWFARHLFMAGNYISDVHNYSDAVEENKDDEVSIDMTLVQEKNSRNTVCGFDKEPQNALNHNCDIPSFVTQLFQNFHSQINKTGIVNAEVTTAKAPWGLGVPLGVTSVNPTNAALGGVSYSALELYGYDLHYTSYLGEWDYIEVSTEARLLSNIGFWGKVKLGADGVWKGVTNLAGKVKNFLFKFKWDNEDDAGFLDGFVSTIVDTSDLNVVLTRRWNRPYFGETVYNARYLTDKEVVSKFKADFNKAFKAAALDSGDEKIIDLIYLDYEDEDFPKFEFDPNKMHNRAAYDVYLACRTHEDGSQTKEGCTKVEPDYQTEQYQFKLWINSGNFSRRLNIAKNNNWPCVAGKTEDEYTEKPSEFMECWYKNADIYSDQIYKDKDTKKKIDEIVKQVEETYTKGNPFVDPKQPIGHYICADENGNPTKTQVRHWEYVYTDYNTRTSENLNPNCEPIRPSIKGGLYGSGTDNTTSKVLEDSDDTRWEIFNKGLVSARGSKHHGLTYSITKFATQLTNTLISLAFSNFIDYLELDKIMETVLKTLRDSIFFPLTTIAVLFYAIWVFTKGATNGFTWSFRDLGLSILVWFIGTVSLYFLPKYIMLAEEVPSKIDNFLANTLLQNNSNNPLCQTSGADADIRTLQCTIWQVTIFNPWLQGQWGVTDYRELDASKMKNNNKKLVGDAEVDMGGGKTVNNWAIWQLSKTKSGSITDENNNIPDGTVYKSIYKLVDLQAGPKNSKDSDTRFLYTWIGANNSDRMTARFWGMVNSILILVVISGFVLLKMELTVEFFLRLIFLPFVIIASLTPNGRLTKTAEYYSNMLAIFLKRIAVVFVLLLTIVFISSLAETNMEPMVMGIAVAATLFAAKLYWKDLVNIISSANTMIENRSMSMIKNAPLSRHAKFKSRTAMRKVSYGTTGAIAGGAAGTLAMIRNRRAGIKADQNEILYGIKQGARKSAGTGAAKLKRAEQRSSYGLSFMTRWEDAKKAGQKVVIDRFKKPDDKLINNVTNLLQVLHKKSTSLTLQIEQLEKERALSIEQGSAVTDKDIVAKDIEIAKLKQQLQGIEDSYNEITNISGGLNSNTYDGYKPSQYGEVNRYLVNLDFAKIDGEANNQDEVDRIINEFSDIVTTIKTKEREKESEELTLGDLAKEAKESASNVVGKVKHRLKSVGQNDFDRDMDAYYSQFEDIAKKLENPVSKQEMIERLHFIYNNKRDIRIKETLDPTIELMLNTYHTQLTTGATKVGDLSYTSTDKYHDLKLAEAYAILTSKKIEFEKPQRQDYNFGGQKIEGETLYDQMQRKESESSEQKDNSTDEFKHKTSVKARNRKKELMPEAKKALMEEISIEKAKAEERNKNNDLYDKLATIETAVPGTIESIMGKDVVANSEVLSKLVSDSAEVFAAAQAGETINPITGAVIASKDEVVNSALYKNLTSEKQSDKITEKINGLKDKNSFDVNDELVKLDPNSITKFEIPDDVIGDLVKENAWIKKKQEHDELVALQNGAFENLVAQRAEDLYRKELNAREQQAQEKAAKKNGETITEKASEAFGDTYSKVVTGISGVKSHVGDKADKTNEVISETKGKIDEAVKKAKQTGRSVIGSIPIVGNVDDYMDSKKGLPDNWRDVVKKEVDKTTESRANSSDYRDGYDEAYEKPGEGASKKEKKQARKAAEKAAEEHAQKEAEKRTAQAKKSDQEYVESVLRGVEQMDISDKEKKRLYEAQLKRIKDNNKQRAIDNRTEKKARRTKMKNKIKNLFGGD